MSLILTLNAGSSSLKFAVYDAEKEPTLIISGQVERLGPDARLIIKDRTPRDLGATDHARAMREILVELEDDLANRPIVGIGHRIVHGGTEFAAPAQLDETVLAKLRELEPLAPLHQPHNLACVDAAIDLFPHAIQIGCFDTAFHRSHPWVNDTFALPRKYYEMGIRRYGFHGLSYDYITNTLEIRFPELAKGRVIIGHLGNGASLCAAQNGNSIASTMGFSALDGLPMGTRSGQVDPGILLYLLDQRSMTSDEISNLLYRQSGLLGLSGISSDMRTLEASDTEAATQAIDYYVFRIQREIGAMAASLGGVDALIFCGGIGENSAKIRRKVCEKLSFLGITLNPEANNVNAESIGSGATQVMVIPTDEERIIARAVSAHCPR